MKILIITASNPYKIAGIVALDFYKGLKSISGHEVKVLVKTWDKYPDKNIIPFESFLAHKRKWLFRKIFSVFKIFVSVKKIYNDDYFIQDINQTKTYYSTKSIFKKVPFIPDLIIILFMQKFLSFKNIYEFNKITKAPVFLYMMDMASMTGGCHYAWNCKGYEKQCGNCPALYSKNALDQSHINWKFKKEYIEKTDITIISGSEWTYQQLKSSTLFVNKPKHKFLLPINENTFKPADKTSTRKQLGLPLNKKIVFFGAVSVTSRRKGIKELMDTLKILSDIYVNSSIIHLAIAGNNIVDIKDLLPFPYTSLGNLDHSQLIKAFQAADVYVSPSIEDSGPMMINQSIMCGTPVVAFEIGIALDLVDTGKTGYRAKLKDKNDLAYGIKTILELDDLGYKRMSTKCRETGLRLCLSQKWAEKMIHLFNNQRELLHEN